MFACHLHIVIWSSCLFPCIVVALLSMLMEEGVQNFLPCIVKLLNSFNTIPLLITTVNYEFFKSVNVISTQDSSFYY